MKNKLKIALLTILTAISVFAVCLFAGCKVDYAALYNDDAQIIKRNSYTAVALVEDTSKYSYSCSKFSGVKEIKSVTVGSGSGLDVKLNIESGDFKLVLTDSSTVYVLTDESFEGVLPFENIPDGRYKLKMVGVEAKFSLKINF
ncbi:MAG: hypothetical protein K2L02_03525 [Clostridia bacterium]|nr:hypothetical protein [Clostridia bacterium]